MEEKKLIVEVLGEVTNMIKAQVETNTKVMMRRTIRDELVKLTIICATIITILTLIGCAYCAWNFFDTLNKIEVTSISTGTNTTNTNINSNSDKNSQEVIK